MVTKKGIAEANKRHISTEGARVRGRARNKVRGGENSGVGLICAKNKNKIAID